MKFTVDELKRRHNVQHRVYRENIIRLERDAGCRIEEIIRKLEKETDRAYRKILVLRDPTHGDMLRVSISG